LISLTFFGCDKTVSIKQIQNKQENTATDDRIQSQPIQENTSPKDEQSADSTDNSMPVETSLDNTTKLQHGDVTKCPQQESQGQFDQPNTDPVQKKLTHFLQGFC
jgi:hypothetical protein